MVAEFMSGLSPEKLEEMQRKQDAAVNAEHAKFKAAYDAGNCYLCGDGLTSFDEGKPCVHWLLNPVGFRKKQHFPKVTEKYGFHQIQSMLRWLANEDGFAKNINDLSDEGTGKLREVTIRYKDLEWSFSCSASDFNGHGSGTHKQPHYHFQMRKGPATIIRYNDFHVLLSDEDVGMISAEISNPRIQRRWTNGEGMKDIFRHEAIEAMIEGGLINNSGDGAGDLKFDYLITADEGTTMSGADIHDMIMEAQKDNVLLGKKLREGRLPNVTVTTYVSPGPDVVEQASRSGRGGKKKSEDK